MTKESTKAPYSRPRLVEYGSVRNLTGGSATMKMDALSGMQTSS